VGRNEFCGKFGYLTLSLRSRSLGSRPGIGNPPALFRRISHTERFNVENVINVAVEICLWCWRVVQTRDKYIFAEHAADGASVDGDINCIRENAIAAITVGHENGGGIVDSRAR